MNSDTFDLSVRPVLLSTHTTKDLWNIPMRIVPQKPSLEDVLYEIGPIPREALFMGCAEDGLPMLLNLHDPAPGPMLIVGDDDSEKTDLLRVFAQFVVSTHTPREIQFAVITDQVEEWPERLSDAPHCVGIFSSLGPDVKRVIHSTSTWIAEVRNPMQSILLLIDGFEDILHWDDATLIHLREVLANGPEERVWPIVTLTQPCHVEVKKWVEYFRLKIVSRNLIDKAAKYTNENVCSTLSPKAPWFSMMEYGKWIHFWLPSLGY